ncbi:ribosome-binding protein 1-like isoform X1 [Rhopilema esculentum]|uniref:ribosome-binding protein 1-like isoform X1 n=1 Tax=Rhopilema esculentum TaxID=499914 RepID=UPI0031D7FEA4
MIEVIGNNGLYVVLAIVVIAVASLFGLVVFVSKEEKFEDVIAAQKKEQEALIQSLNSTAAKPSKSKKKWQKIKKEKSVKAQERKDEPEATEELGPSEDMMNEEIVLEQLTEIEIPKIETEDISKAPKKTKGKEKKKKQKVADDSSNQKPIVPVEEQIVEAVEEVVEAVQEVGELETVPESAFLQQAVEEIPKEPLVLQEQKQTEAPVSQKKAKSKKAKPQVTAGGDSTVKRIANDVEKAQLTNNDVQKLIDTLLDKQNELQQWQKPNQKADPMDELKKRVNDLELQLSEEKKTSLSAAHKNKELRQEVQQEKTQLQRFQTQANQKISQQANEIQALQKRMEATQENHLREMQNSQGQLQKMKELLEQTPAVELTRLQEESSLYNNASLRIKQLTDEKNALLQTSAALRADLESTRANLQNYHQQQKHYEEKLKALESEVKNLQHSKGDSEAVYSSRLAEVSKQLERSEAENKNLSDKLHQAHKNLGETEKSRQDLVEKLNHAAKETSGGKEHELKLVQTEEELENVKSALKTAVDKVKHFEETEAKNSELLKKLADEKIELQEKLKRDEIIIVEKQQSNGDVADSGVSQQEHMQLITEKDKVISELKEDVKSTKEELERLAKVLEQEKHEKDENVKTLQEKLQNQEEAIAEQKKENKKMEEVVEMSKSKNNDLREKNWKAMDALSTTEANCKKKLNENQERVFKMLKKIRPEIKLEKDKPLPDVLSSFEEEFLKSDKKKRSRDSGSSSSSGSDSDSDSDSGSKSVKKLKNENENLVQSNKSLESKLADLMKEKSTLEKNLEEVSGEKEQLKQSAEENKSANVQAQYYKGILEQTEGMLKELQVSVESRVSSYESKLESKELELKQVSEKVKRLEEEIKNNDDKSQLEKDLSNIQAELDSEKKAKHELESELEEAKNRIHLLEEVNEHGHSEDSIGLSQESLDTSGSASPKKKKSIRHALSKAFRKKAESPDELRSKFAAAEENLKKLEGEKKELLDKLGQISDSFKSKEEEITKLNEGKQAIDKEMKKLQEKLNAVKDAENVSGKSDKEKDKIIAKLRLENAELLDDLREERDRVVVDVESVDSEKLKSELEVLKDDFEKEKNTSSKLNSSIQELEEQLEKKRLELDQLQQKYKGAADKLVVAEQRSKELELAGLTKSERIEKEIDEAIQGDNSPTSPQRSVGTPLVDQLDEIKRQLTDKEKQLDMEKQVSQQLRAQVAALASDAAHGTSV